MARTVIDLRGKTYGRLNVRHFAGIFRGKSYWCCRCECGSSVKVSGTYLVCGRTKSCGCYRADPAIRQCARDKVPSEVRSAIARKGGYAKGGSPSSRQTFTFTVERAAERLGITTERMQVLVDAGHVASKIKAGRQFVATRDVEALADSGMVTAVAKKQCPLA